MDKQIKALVDVVEEVAGLHNVLLDTYESICDIWGWALDALPPSVRMEQKWPSGYAPFTYAEPRS